MKKSKRIISILLVTVLILTIIPINVFAQSIGEGNSKTQVSLTIADSNLVVSVPTTIVLNGTPNENGEYVGEYSVKASGDIAGDKVVNIKPQEYNISLHQKDRTDKEALITQEKTEFTSEDLKNNQSANGKVVATKLLAGNWYGTANFELSITPSVSHIAKTVMGYNVNVNDWGAILGTDNRTTENSATTYDAYVLPIEEMSLKNGDTLICTNLQTNKNFIYTAYFLNKDFKYIKGSNYVWKGQNREIPITEDIKYMYFTVVNEVNVNNKYNKEDIPFEDFILYKNEISDNNKIDFISIWNDMITFDNNFKINEKKMGHNVEWDYSEKEMYVTSPLEYRLNYYDMYDIDIKLTSDKVPIAAHLDNLNYSKMTLKEVKEKYPKVMTFEEVILFAKNHNKIIYVEPIGKEVEELINKHNAKDFVFIQRFNTLDDASTTVFPLKKAQWSCIGATHFNEQYIKNWQKRYPEISLCSGGYTVVDHFTDEQIDWCVENNIEVGVGFFGGNMSDPRHNSYAVTNMIHFFKNHDKSVMDKIDYFMYDNEETSELLIKAAYRYVYGM